MIFIPWNAASQFAPETRKATETRRERQGGKSSYGAANSTGEINVPISKASGHLEYPFQGMNKIYRFGYKEFQQEALKDFP